MRGTCFPSAWGSEEAFEVRGEEVHVHDCPWVLGYYSTIVSLDRNDADRSDRSHTDCNHLLIGIGCRNIWTVPRPSDVGFLISNDHLRGGNCRLLAVNPRTVDARHS